MNRFAPKKITRRHNSVALGAIITMREDLSSIDVPSLAKSYGASECEVWTMITKEIARRAGR